MFHSWIKRIANKKNYLEAPPTMAIGWTRKLEGGDPGSTACQGSGAERGTGPARGGLGSWSSWSLLSLPLEEDDEEEEEDDEDEDEEDVSTTSQRRRVP